MPTYEYECKSCDYCFEVFQSMSDAPVKICPECGKEVRRLIFGGAGIIFKGSGFYVTDKNKSDPKTSSGDKKSKSTSSKSNLSSAAKTETSSGAGSDPAPKIAKPACQNCPKNEKSCA
jgi:putative FmdB family regulatory protein